MLTGIFSFGAALGLFAAAWCKKNPQQAAVIVDAARTGVAPHTFFLEDRIASSGSKAPVSSTVNQAPQVSMEEPLITDDEQPSFPQIVASGMHDGEQQARQAKDTIKSKPQQPSLKTARHRAKAKKSDQPDHEIDRMKRQAGDELTGKSREKLHKSSATKDSVHRPYVGTAIARTSKRMLLTQCEQAPNFIQRERCKWSVCNGAWGKDGCPAYDKPRGLF